MADEKDVPEKKDMTGIFEMPQAEMPAANENPDPFAVNVMPEAEPIDSFESIDQIGMMDHVIPNETRTEAFTEATLQNDLPPTADPFAADPFATDPFAAAIETDTPSVILPHPVITPAPFNALEEIKQYSDHTRTSSQDVPIHYPFHLLIQGHFGPFERDKLLLFITENQFGISSVDLDLQIKGGRVLFPRISEYAGIRLIQELRDSGLQFSLKASPRDDDEPIEHASALKFQFDSSSAREAPSPIAVIATGSGLLSQYDEVDSVQSHQFIKAEMIEVERSDLFQEVIERMTESLKQKVRTRGGHALTRLKHEVNPLRLPSQYQISVSAVVLRKRE